MSQTLAHVRKERTKRTRKKEQKTEVVCADIRTIIEAIIWLSFKKESFVFFSLRMIKSTPLMHHTGRGGAALLYATCVFTLLPAERSLPGRAPCVLPAFCLFVYFQRSRAEDSRSLSLSALCSSLYGSASNPASQAASQPPCLLVCVCDPKEPWGALSAGDANRPRCWLYVCGCALAKHVSP